MTISRRIRQAVEKSNMRMDDFSNTIRTAPYEVGSDYKRPRINYRPLKDIDANLSESGKINNPGFNKTGNKTQGFGPGIISQNPDSLANLQNNSRIKQNVRIQFKNPMTGIEDWRTVKMTPKQYRLFQADPSGFAQRYFENFADYFGPGFIVTDWDLDR